MELGIIIAVVVLVIVGGVFVKNSLAKKREEEERQRRIAEEEARKLKIQQEKEERRLARLAEIEAGNEIYHYMNQSIKTMFYHYRTEKWNDMTTMGEISLHDREAAKRCIGKLSFESRQLVGEFFSCLDLDEELKGSGDVKDSEKLRNIFEGIMLPFFPVYYRVFSSGPRYVSFLNQKILRVFAQLSGKKFRLGYKNKYQNGQIAFEWHDHVYRVFRADGKQLCEASFSDGKVRDGYLILKQEDNTSDDWDIYKKQVWKKGILVQEDVQYLYRNAIG